MNKKTSFIFIKSSFVYILLFLLILFSAANPQSSIAAAKDALVLCFNTIIPSLFPFFVFSNLLIKTGFAELLKKALSFIANPLFNVNGSGILAFIVGILSGYPAGARITCELYEEKLITKNEAQRLLPFCNNSGPLFIIGVVGCVMLKSTACGIFLYIVHVLSAVLVGICFRFYARADLKKTQKSKPELCTCKIKYSLGRAFAESVESSVSAVLNICGFIVVFSCFINAVTPVLNALFWDENLNLFIKGIFEITLGISGISACPLKQTDILILTSVLTGFGGICVLLQVAGIVSKTDIGIKTYLSGKLLQAAFSGIICAVSLKTGICPVFSSNDKIANLHFALSDYTLILSLFFAILCIWLKKHKLF